MPWQARGTPILDLLEANRDKVCGDGVKYSIIEACGTGILLHSKSSEGRLPGVIQHVMASGIDGRVIFSATKTGEHSYRFCQIEFANPAINGMHGS